MQRPWARFRSPPGQPTNIVWQVGHPSERDLDGVLLSIETPSVGAEHHLLPGLSTQHMPECNLRCGDGSFTAADPPCRIFWWSQLRPE